MVSLASYPPGTPALRKRQGLLSGVLSALHGATGSPPWLLPLVEAPLPDGCQAADGAPQYTAESLSRLLSAISRERAVHPAAIRLTPPNPSPLDIES